MESEGCFNGEQKFWKIKKTLALLPCDRGTDKVWFRYAVSSESDSSNPVLYKTGGGWGNGRLKRVNQHSSKAGIYRRSFLLAAAFLGR